MAQYNGMSLRDIYTRRCDELGCRHNSQLVKLLPTKPDFFDAPSTIDMSINFVGPKGLVPLLEVVRCCTGLRTLDLRDQHMTNESVELLCNAIQHHPSLVRLNLSNNPITIAGGRCLLDLTKINAVLESILLENTDVRPAITGSIANQLAKNKQEREARMQKQAERTAEIEEGNQPDGKSGQPNGHPLDIAVARNALDSYPFSIAPYIFDQDVSGELTALCRKYNARFCDPQFSPVATSIKRGAPHEEIREWRPVDPCGGLFPAGNDPLNMPTEVRPGFEWIFTCLGVAASEHGGVDLRQMIAPATVNPSGVYSVRFFIDGKWRFVVVDDNIPLQPNGRPAFTEYADNCFWPCIFVKALAKLHSCYQAIDRSVLARHPLERPASCCMTLADLTGGIGISRDIHHEEFNADEWFGSMLELMPKRALLIATSCKADTAGMLEGLGIDLNAAYHVMKVRQLNGFRLIQLRNPYAQRVYVGEWSRKSPLWDQYPEIAAALDQQRSLVSVKPDAPFWIPYTKFLHTFNAVHICRPLIDQTTTILEGQWDRASAGGPYFEPTWFQNPHYRLSLPTRGQAVINLSLPDERFSTNEITTVAFHVLKSDSYPLKLERENVVARTSYVITNTVSFEGGFEAGDVWLVPSVYVANKLGKYLLRVSCDVPFSIAHESMANYWKQINVRTRVDSSGEYQVGEDNAQFAVSIPPDVHPARLFVQLYTPETEQLSLALFLCNSAKKERSRLLGNVPEHAVVAKSKFLISNTVTLNARVSGGSEFVLLTCVSPEKTNTSLMLSVWCSHPKFNVVELPVWKQKTVECFWERSGGYQETARNPQVELTGLLPLQTVVIRCQAIGCSDPSVVFFVVKNEGHVGDRLKGRLEDDSIALKSVFVRHHTALKEFVVGPAPCDSYVIVPCLQPPGSRAKCVVTVSSISDAFTLRELPDAAAAPAAIAPPA